MEEERYLEIFTTQSELGPNLKDIILLKLEEKYKKRGIQGKIIINKKLGDLNNIPLSVSTTSIIEISAPVKVIPKI